MAKISVLILGATGMLGNGLFWGLNKRPNLKVWGTTRGDEGKKYFSSELNKQIMPFVDVLDAEGLLKLFSFVKPDMVINGVGLIKQNPDMDDTHLAIELNSLLPHRLAEICGKMEARLIHFSTDCVFSGLKGNYLETDPSDAKDIYGKSKFLGEVTLANALTVRTSIIGHGLETHLSLIDWFLVQKKSINGYKNVIYSGLPTVEWANIIADYILPNSKLSGLYHVAAEPIAKIDLLNLVSKIYGKKIAIKPVREPINDRSLNADRFRKRTGYQPPKWPILIKKMHQYYQTNSKFVKF